MVKIAEQKDPSKSLKQIKNAQTFEPYWAILGCLAPNLAHSGLFWATLCNVMPFRTKFLSILGNYGQFQADDGYFCGGLLDHKTKFGTFLGHNWQCWTILSHFCNFFAIFLPPDYGQFWEKYWHARGCLFTGAHTSFKCWNILRKSFRIVHPGFETGTPRQKCFIKFIIQEKHPVDSWYTGAQEFTL